MKFQPLDSDGKITGEQSLKLVGQWLRTAREQKGESLDDVAKITRIGKSYLEALEEGSAGKLPSMAYTRGFVRLYAAHLGLLPDETLRMMNGQTADVPQHEEQGVFSAPVANRPINQPTVGSGITKKLLFPLICVVVVVAIFAALLHRNSRKSLSPENQPVASVNSPAGATPVVSAPATPPPKIDSPSDAAVMPHGSGEITAQGIVLRLKAVSAGRLHITIDGSVSQEYDLVAGDLVEWKAENMFLLDLENASSVEGELDGKPLKPFGEAGKSAHLIIRQDGVQQD